MRCPHETDTEPAVYIPTRQRAAARGRSGTHPLLPPASGIVRWRRGGGGQPSPARREGFAAAVVVFYGSVARVNWRGEIYGRSAAASRAARSIGLQKVMVMSSEVPSPQGRGSLRPPASL